MLRAISFRFQFIVPLCQVLDIGVTYSYVRYNPATSGIKSFSMNGGSGSVSVNFKSWLGGIADVGDYSKHNILGTGVSGSLSTYLFGPRVSVNRYAPSLKCWRA